MMIHHTDKPLGPHGAPLRRHGVPTYRHNFRSVLCSTIQVQAYLSICLGLYTIQTYLYTVYRTDIHLGLYGAPLHRHTCTTDMTLYGTDVSFALKSVIMRDQSLIKLKRHIKPSIPSFPFSKSQIQGKFRRHLYCVQKKKAYPPNIHPYSFQ